jgi:hypothetical protein
MHLVFIWFVTRLIGTSRGHLLPNDRTKSRASYKIKREDNNV